MNKLTFGSAFGRLCGGPTTCCLSCKFTTDSDDFEVRECAGGGGYSTLLGTLDDRNT